MFDSGRSLAKTFVGCLDTDWLLGIAPRKSKRYDVLKSHCKIAMKYDSFLLGLYIYNIIMNNIHTLKHTYIYIIYIYIRM